ncbi:unnamed protein product [Chondrus crispus]|uniref:Uncharacterized protein n=1 Tax=Chondrus crispus TaxID=2769 RepID=R7Q8G8_CHOCR|nr:unnamed protein product [Chondrus crispus]CDF33775.1 unnamed protein product [Chondrus crispus]|eukprot:XP_005713594.1 unnamed protein product [Chondrus crispus]
MRTSKLEARNGRRETGAARVRAWRRGKVCMPGCVIDTVWAKLRYIPLVRMVGRG